MIFINNNEIFSQNNGFDFVLFLLTSFYFTLRNIKITFSESRYPANNGEPFRFRIGSVKSAQLFQLSAENFFRLRYESVPLQ